MAACIERDGPGAGEAHGDTWGDVSAEWQELAEEDGLGAAIENNTYEINIKQTNSIFSYLVYKVEESG